MQTLALQENPQVDSQLNRFGKLALQQFQTMLRTNQEQTSELERVVRKTGKLDYLELPAGGKIDAVKSFYSTAFGWRYTDYGPGYSAFEEGIDGGFDDAMSVEETKPLPVLFSENLEETLSVVENAGGRIVKPIFSFPGGRRFHFTDPAGNELAVWSET